KPNRPPTMVCFIEIDQPDAKKAVFQIDKTLAKRIEESLASLIEIGSPPFPRKPSRDGPTIQNRFEDETSGLVVMWEILPFRSNDDIKAHYKLGDGAGRDYVFESSGSLFEFVNLLKRLTSAGPVWE